MKKRFLSVLLTLFMMLAVMPVIIAMVREKRTFPAINSETQIIIM